MPHRLASLLTAAALAGCSHPATPPPEGTAHRRDGGGNTVRFASTDGRFVGLADGSLWNIDWRDAATASSWRPGAPVHVRRGPEGDFPYRLTDAAGHHADARRGKRLD